MVGVRESRRQHARAAAAAAAIGVRASFVSSGVVAQPKFLPDDATYFAGIGSRAGGFLWDPFCQGDELKIPYRGGFGCREGGKGTAGPLAKLMAEFSR